ncbi:MAG: Type 1 glutamine amidotransferase-like domain-containing protein [Parcubacteria group bacterium]|nr:Type 1 glutamine amidotransferase-like domain-containing protein [Parcubacteria group bacterium]
MTKFILHGGETSRKTEDNKKFFFEMTADKENPVKVLCIYFARPKDDWGRLFQQDRASFSEVAPTRQIKFERANNKPEIFNSQVKKADVIYMRGGTTEILLDTLKTIGNFSDLIKNKVISGSSAGACVLSKYYCTGSKDTPITEGLGILNIKTIVHYDSSNEKLLQDLRKHGDKILEIYKIPEEKFFIISK